MTISVNEIACGDPACPGGVETVILTRAKGTPTKAAKVPGPIEAVTDAALARALGVGP